MKVIVAGGRDFDDYQLMCARLDHFFQYQDKKSLVIVNGKGPGKPGADALAERYAKERGYQLEFYPPDWDVYGKAAGPIRNKQMAENAHALVAFNTGGSGTASMIKYAEEFGLKIRIVECIGKQQNK